MLGVTRPSSVYENKNDFLVLIVRKPFELLDIYRIKR